MKGGMEYIRATYGVPARRGARVVYTGDPKGPRRGTIVGTSGPHIRVRLDGGDRAGKYHPTWEMTYE